MHSLRAGFPRVSPDAVISQAGRLRAFGRHVEDEVDGWRPSLDSWVGQASSAHHRSVVAFKTPVPAMAAGIGQVADLVAELGSAIAAAQDELVRLARMLEASLVASRDGDHDDALTEDLRRRAEARANEILEELRRIDQRTASEIDQVLTRPFRPPRWDARPRPANQRRRLIDAVSATRERIELHIASLSTAISLLQSRPWEHGTSSESTALTHLTRQLSLHEQFLTPGRQILEWDPAGDGRVVEVFGDLGTARHIAVVVPGIMNTIRNFDRMHGRRSKDLWRAAAEIDSEVAVVAWLGYDTPELVDAVSKSRAVEYQSALRSFVERLPSDAHVTVVAHSYGTVLAGEAAARGLGVSDLVVLGSPGTRFDRVGQMALRSDAQVWAGVSDTDRVVGRSSVASVFCPEIAIGAGRLAPARWIINPLTIPVSRAFDACQTDADGDVKGLSHGMNPSHEDFGAIEIDTTGVNGHSSYFDPGTPTLEDVARIVTGTHPDQD